MLKPLARVTTVLSFSLLAFAAANAQETKRLETPQGLLLGELTGPANQIESYKGIPYAAPPTGIKRWQPPAPPATWAGERLATEFGPNCIQQPYALGSFFARPSRVSSEDCLYLNVWSKGASGGEKPVMVWIHGGALTRGSGATATYDGSNLAMKDVVVVTINYRLGVFGYFAHPELVEESPNKAAGNYGILDQVAALQWVQDNISAFGGDPNNVTIFGESAGSWSVNFLTAAPMAKGLFHKAIGESGGKLDPRPTLATATQHGLEVAQAIGANNLAELRAIPAEELLAKAQEARFRTDGVVDGWVLPDQMYTIYSEGRQHPTPVMVGFNRDEGTTLGALSRLPENDDVYIANASRSYGELSDEFLAVYPPNDLRRATLDANRDRGFGWNMLTWARMMKNVDQDAYLYFFTYAPSGPRQEELGAYHAAEISYAFGNADKLRNGATAIDEQVAETMSNYWVQFAKTGNPNVAGQPEWQAYTREHPNYIVLDEQAQPAYDLTPAAWDFFDQVYAERRGE